MRVAQDISVQFSFSSEKMNNVHHLPIKMVHRLSNVKFEGTNTKFLPKPGQPQLKLYLSSKIPSSNFAKAHGCAIYFILVRTSLM